jgi:hypothetical protein
MGGIPAAERDKAEGASATDKAEADKADGILVPGRD